MITKKLAAGDIIEARCTRCRDVLNHRIVAMVGDKIVRVECNTCGGMHNYYPPPSAKTPKTPKTPSEATARKSSTSGRSAQKNPSGAEREEWEALRPGMEIEKAVPYDMNGKYKVNTLVKHTAFGIGIVKLIIFPNKMQVLFQDGIKLLRCQ